MLTRFEIRAIHGIIMETRLSRISIGPVDQQTCDILSVLLPCRVHTSRMDKMKHYGRGRQGSHHAYPLPECFLGLMLIGLCAPIEHVGCKVKTRTLAKSLDNSGGIVQQIVCIYNTYLDTLSDSIRGVGAIWIMDPVGVSYTVGGVHTIQGVYTLGGMDAVRGLDLVARFHTIQGFGAIEGRSCIGISMCHSWPNLADRAEVVKQPAELFVTRLGRHEVVKPSDLVQWGDTASIVRWNARTWMSYQEGKMEVPQRIPRDDGRVVWLSIRIVRIRSPGGTIRGTVVHGLGGSNATLDSTY